MIANDFRDDIIFSEENYDDVIINLEKYTTLLTNDTKAMKEEVDDLS